ncbi:metalloprotease [Rubritalea spongiae]|uniref:Metalloprotease n=1 Tax=Rubritalea spongiae TaxID=430797 RepID=A0ABW5DZY4_9BACT
MVEFKLFGIPVKVMPIFWITLGIIGLIGSDIRDGLGLLEVALFVLAGFLSILIHEMGHALMIKKYKLPTQVVLASFGGYAVYPAGVLNRLQSFLVTAAGPGLQILGGLVVLAALNFIELPNSMINLFFYNFLWVSFAWAILNCVPILPLDGGQMLSAIMGPKRQNAVFIISFSVAALLAITALVYQQIFLVLFMGMFAYQNFQAWQQSKGK